jgi:polyisoprenoid-binding protein YceI
MLVARFRPWILGASLACALVPIGADAQLSRIGTPEVAFVCAGPLGMKVEGSSTELTTSNDGTTVVVTVPLAPLSTGLELRDRVIRRSYLEVEKYPRAELRVPRSALRLPRDGKAASGVARGTLTLHGVTRPVTFRWGAHRVGHAYDVLGFLQLDAREFGIDTTWTGVAMQHDVDVRVRFRALDVP